MVGGLNLPGARALEVGPEILGGMREPRRVHGMTRRFGRHRFLRVRHSGPRVFAQPFPDRDDGHEGDQTEDYRSSHPATSVSNHAPALASSANGSRIRPPTTRHITRVDVPPAPPDNRRRGQCRLPDTAPLCRLQHAGEMEGLSNALAGPTSRRVGRCGSRDASPAVRDASRRGHPSTPATVSAGGLAAGAIDTPPLCAVSGGQASVLSLFLTPWRGQPHTDAGT